MNRQLEAILEQKRMEIALLPPASPMVTDSAIELRVPGCFDAALRLPGLSIIAEFKRQSPSAGNLAIGLDAPLMAQRFERHGAAAMSCLTDEMFFAAEADDFMRVRQAVDIPVLRKDFILDERQLEQSSTMQAHAILLIVRMLSPARLTELLRHATALDLDVLVETHNAEEIKTALDAGARIIGINNRDLDDFSTDFNRCLRLRQFIPSGCVAVAESAINTPEDISKLCDAEFDAALVGMALMTATNPDLALSQLVEAGQRTSENLAETVIAEDGVRS